MEGVRAEGREGRGGREREVEGVRAEGRDGRGGRERERWRG